MRYSEPPAVTLTAALPTTVQPAHQPPRVAELGVVRLDNSALPFTVRMVRFPMTTTLSSKGQVVIPLEIRSRLGLPTGALIDCNLEDGRIILTPVVQSNHARVVVEQDYIALDAPDGAPTMTPKRVKDILSEL